MKIPIILWSGNIIGNDEKRGERVIMEWLNIYIRVGVTSKK